MKAPPKEQIDVCLSAYGMLMGAVSAPKARMWLIVQADGTVLCRVATNDPQTGVAVYQDLGAVSSAEIRHGQSGRTIQIQTASGVVTVVEAPCVCGAGAIGYAGPASTPHSVRVVPAPAVVRTL